jgi:tetratricopeptide (TPR) repeat protein
VQGDRPKLALTVVRPTAGDALLPLTPASPQPAMALPTPRSSLEACQRAVDAGASRKAQEVCRDAVAANHADAPSLTLLAQAKLLAGRESEAVALAKKAVAADPRNADAYLIMGSIAQGAGQTAEAKRAYETYLRLAPRGSHASDIRSILGTM